jgi:hypothetical protein
MLGIATAGSVRMIILPKHSLYPHTGDTKGTRPRFATVNARAIVANGAERALPMVERRSNETPKILSSKMADRTNDGSLCKMDCTVVSETGIDRRDVDDDDAG